MSWFLTLVGVLTVIGSVFELAACAEPLSVAAAASCGAAGTTFLAGCFLFGLAAIIDELRALRKALSPPAAPKEPSESAPPRIVVAASTPRREPKIGRPS